MPGHLPEADFDWRNGILELMSVGKSEKTTGIVPKQNAMPESVYIIQLAYGQKTAYASRGSALAARFLSR